MQVPNLTDGKLYFGSGDWAVTPNFRRSEFNTDVMFYDSVQVLQLFRDEAKLPVRIEGVYEEGKSVRISIDDSDGTMLPYTDHILVSMLYDRFIADFRLSEISGRLYIEIDINPSSPITWDAFWPLAFKVVSGYETSGDPYEQVTGNFDGAGISFGMLQWNAKTGTLSKLFNEFEKVNIDQLHLCFGGLVEYAKFRGAIDGTARDNNWAYLITSAGQVNPDVEHSLRRIGHHEPFRKVQLEQAIEGYGHRAQRDALFLQEHTGRKVNGMIELTALLDCAVQQGGLAKVRGDLSKYFSKHKTRDSWTATSYAVGMRAIAAYRRWVADCLSRRKGILYRRPQTVMHSGYRVTRENPYQHMIFNRPVK